MSEARLIDSRYAFWRLAASLALGTIGGVGMWSPVVILPEVQAEFGVGRGTATLPITLLMIGFGLGGVLLGRAADRFGIVPVILAGIAALGLGYVWSGLAPSFWQFALANGLLIGTFGCAAVFGPLMADVSHWFRRYRGIAVATAAMGNYLAATLWSPVVEHFTVTQGWRPTMIGIGIFCVLAMLPLTLVLRRTVPLAEALAEAARGALGAAALGLSPRLLTGLLMFAGFACCVAMSMPQLHIVAYCGDLGYGTGPGATMLALMTGFGMVSRIASGLLADRVGGLATLLINSVLQTLAIALYLGFTSLPSLYVIAILFGLSQGGLVPSYAIIIRAYFPPSEAGARIGLVLACTMLGMAVGGWMNGVIFDITGSYTAAFINGVAWNVAHAALALFLLLRGRGHSTLRPAPVAA